MYGGGLKLRNRGNRKLHRAAASDSELRCIEQERLGVYARKLLLQEPALWSRRSIFPTLHMFRGEDDTRHFHLLSLLSPRNVPAVIYLGPLHQEARGLVDGLNPVRLLDLDADAQAVNEQLDARNGERIE
jgi:hypothetical protein